MKSSGAVSEIAYQGPEVNFARGKRFVGSFRCMLYTVMSTDDEGRSVRSRFWFARELPGAPIRMIREVDGEVALEMQLVGHEPPIDD